MAGTVIKDGGLEPKPIDPGTELTALKVDASAELVSLDTPEGVETFTQTTVNRLETLKPSLTTSMQRLADKLQTRILADPTPFVANRKAVLSEQVAFCDLQIAELSKTPVEETPPIVEENL